MASEALRRLAARVADLSIFEGSSGNSLDPAVTGVTGAINDKGVSEDAAGAAAEPVPPHGDPDPDLAWLSPQAHTIFDCSPGHSPEMRTRQPDGNWSALRPLNVIPFPGQPPDATIHRRRPPSWSDPRDEPQPGDCCTCCDGGIWWTEVDGPRGWRCETCHPPPIGGVRQVRT